MYDEWEKKKNPRFMYLKSHTHTYKHTHTHVKQNEIYTIV